MISAVGHEIDFTLSDFAADLRAPTLQRLLNWPCPNAAATGSFWPNWYALLERAMEGKITDSEKALTRLQEDWVLTHPERLWKRPAKPGYPGTAAGTGCPGPDYSAGAEAPAPPIRNWRPWTPMQSCGGAIPLQKQPGAGGAKCRLAAARRYPGDPVRPGTAVSTVDTVKEG